MPPKTTSIPSNSSRTARRPGFDNELIEDMRKSAPFEIKQQVLLLDRHSRRRQHRKVRHRDHGITSSSPRKDWRRSNSRSPIADATHFYLKRKDDKSISSIKESELWQDGRCAGRQRHAGAVAGTQRLNAGERGQWKATARSSNTPRIRKPIWRSRARPRRLRRQHRESTCRRWSSKNPARLNWVRLFPGKIVPGLGRRQGQYRTAR